MEKYKNLSRVSGVLAYQIGDDFIVVRFHGSGIVYYKYTYNSAGKLAVEKMKQLAENGRGLNTYISSKDTRPQYQSKGATSESVL